MNLDYNVGESVVCLIKIKGEEVLVLGKYVDKETIIYHNTKVKVIHIFDKMCEQEEENEY